MFAGRALEFWIGGVFPDVHAGEPLLGPVLETILKEIPDLEKQMAKGEFAALRVWLLEKIHRHGKRYRAAELCEKVTGKAGELSP